MVLKVCSCGNWAKTRPCPECRDRKQRARNAQPSQVAHRSRAHDHLRRQVFKRDGYRCRDCGSQIDLTLDYLVSLKDGGRKVMGNAVTRCRSHNSSRGRVTT